MSTQSAQTHSMRRWCTQFSQLLCSVERPRRRAQQAPCAQHASSAAAAHALPSDARAYPPPALPCVTRT